MKDSIAYIIVALVAAVLIGAVWLTAPDASTVEQAQTSQAAQPPSQNPTGSALLQRKALISPTAARSLRPALLRAPPPINLQPATAPAEPAEPAAQPTPAAEP